MKTQGFNIAVCDDEQADRELIAAMTEEVCKKEDICAEIVCFADAESLLRGMEERRYDLLLIDVLMPEQSGMELARYLQQKKQEAPLVLISNNKEMALQGYEVSAARYLAKPLDPEKLREAVLYAYGMLQSRRELFLPVDGRLKKVSPKEIYYIEIAGRKTRVKQEKEEWETNVLIGEIEEMLAGQGFVRCHQSFLVNCLYVRVFHTSSLELADGRIIPISKHRIKEVRKTFFEYMKK